MTRKPIKSLDDIFERCIEVGECWEWQRAASGEGIAYAWFEGKAQPVRRIALILAYKRPLDKGEVASMRCSNPRCVRPHPAHIVRCTVKAHRQHLQEMGVGKGTTPARVISCRSRPTNKLSMAAAREARSANLSVDEIVKRYGCSRGNAYELLAGRIWREHMVGASVFSMGAS